MTATDAYLTSFPTNNRKQAVKRACMLRQKPKVAAAIDAVNEVLQMTGVKSKRELAMFLSQAIDQPASVVDQDSEFAQDIISDEIDEFGDRKVRVKVVDKLKAGDMLSKMMGYYEPEKVDVDSSGLKSLLDMVRKG